jgi:S-adenosylmethionine:tRNA ribosyltransferase-isomerase
VLVSDFNFRLPDELIAQQPLADRAGARLLHLERASGRVLDDCFRDFPGLLKPHDLVIFNDSRVFPARLYGRRRGSEAQNLAAAEFPAGQIEVLLTHQVSREPNEWECLARPGRKIRVGEKLFFGHADHGHAFALEAEVISRGSSGERRIRFEPVADFFASIERLGHVPLPPYIDRKDVPADKERYQTVYARDPGSVAAPTAGLHFTRDILANIHDRGIETANITLHVGLGTFQPVRVDEVEKHKLHRESYNISVESAEAINRALEAGRRVVAVGTTTVRTLEYAAQQAGTGRLQAGSGEADIFIYPGYKFGVVGGLLTNFHLSQSTLLMLVCAFAGTETTLAAYEHAVQQRYRFYSYGDCMFIE